MAKVLEPYLYRVLGTNDLVEVPMTIGEMFERQDELGRITLDDGREAVRAVDVERQRAGGVQRAERLKLRPSYPKVVVQLGCHPNQVESERAKLRAHGVPTEFNRNGDPIVQSRRHQKRLCEIYGMANKDGSYGD